MSKRSRPDSTPVAAHGIESRIVLVRGQKVLLDADLARLYGVATGRLNEQVKRNRERFPGDFLFRLTKHEVTALRSQIAISKPAAGRGGRRYAPTAFTEHGAIMAATVLNSPRAVEMSLYVVRAFVRLREVLAATRSSLGSSTNSRRAWAPMTGRSARSCGRSASSPPRPS
jgi:ORF6N domain